MPIYLKEKFLVKKVINLLANFLFKILKQKKDKFLFHSFPDFADNSLAFYIYLDQKSKFEAIWLVDDIHFDDLKKFAQGIGSRNKIHFVKKNSIIGLYHFFTSDFVFCTHGIFRKLGRIKNHKVINLWHGMPIKKIENFTGSEKIIPDNSNYYVVTNGFYRNLFSKIFNINTKNIFVSGLPRNDLLFLNSNILKKINKNNFAKNILWMPTYRVNSDLSKEFQLNIEKLNKLFMAKNYLCIIKSHPLDVRFTKLKQFSNIEVVDDQFFKVNNKIFYNIFSEVDLLITDFSSVFIDFMLTQKPIIFFVDDFEIYKKSRGFIFDNLDDLLPGDIIKSFSKLESVIENFDFDNYEFNYKISINHFHDVKSNFSHKLYEHISDI